MGGARRTHGRQERCVQEFCGKPGGKRLLGRPRRIREDNIKKDLQQVGWVGMNWIYLAQNSDMCRAVVNAVMNIRAPQTALNFLTS